MELYRVAGMPCIDAISMRFLAEIFKGLAAGNLGAFTIFLLIIRFGCSAEKSHADLCRFCDVLPRSQYIPDGASFGYPGFLACQSMPLHQHFVVGQPVPDVVRHCNADGPADGGIPPGSLRHPPDDFVAMDLGAVRETFSHVPLDGLRLESSFSHGRHLVSCRVEIPASTPVFGDKLDACRRGPPTRAMETDRLGS